MTVRKWICTGYCLLIVKLIVFKLPMAQMKMLMENWNREVIIKGVENANFKIFKTIQMYVEYAYMLNSFENLIGNVAVFIPFGILFPWANKGRRCFLRTLLVGFLFILGIETFQMCTGFGVFDIDDILLNFAGVAIGYLFYKILAMYL